MSKQKRSFEDVYTDHFSYVYNMIYMHLLNREEAEDLTSETFIKALDAYDRYDPAIASERTWLCNIANRLLIDEYRTNARHQTDELSDEMMEVIPDTDNAIERINNDVNDTVRKLLKKLSPEERSLLIMRYYNDAKNPEIAEKLGISLKAVSERYRRLLMKCRNILGDDFDFDFD